jgi:hypothetical protein
MDNEEEEPHPKASELLAAGYNDSMCRQLMESMRGSTVEEIKRAQLDSAFAQGYVTICPRCHDKLVLSQIALGDYLEVTGGDQEERAVVLTRIAEICGVELEARIRFMRDCDKPFLLCLRCAEKVNENLYEESIEEWPVELGSS